ncbi:MAG: MFS transporter [Actinomycetota bacterium]|nr:MFS transporter [Actinomycetota bacterium]
MDDVKRRYLPEHPVFRRLLQVQMAHAAGDALVALALVNSLFFAVPLGEARDKVALYLLLTMAPFALLSPLVGPLLDRFRGSYRIAIIASAFARCVLALLLSTRTERLWLYPLAFGSLVFSRAHGVSRSAIVPDSLPEGRSNMWGNAWLAVISVVGGTLAAGPGLLINHVLSEQWTLKLAFVVFALGGIAAFDLRKPAVTERRREHVHDFRALLSPRILAGGVAAASIRAAVGFLVFFLAFVLRAQGRGAKGLGAAVVAATVGGFVASIATPVLRRVLHESALLVLAPLSAGVAALWAIGRFDTTSAAIVAGITGTAAGAARLAFDSLLQHQAPEEVRGRTFARYETIFQVFWVGGAALATAIPFSAAYGLRAMAAICFGGVVASFWRFVRREPRGPDVR